MTIIAPVCLYASPTDSLSPGPVKGANKTDGQRSGAVAEDASRCP